MQSELVTVRAMLQVSYAFMLSTPRTAEVALPVERRLHHDVFQLQGPKKVMLAFWRKRFLEHGHGFFTEVIDDKDGVRATLGDFDDPGP